MAHMVAQKTGHGDVLTEFLGAEGWSCHDMLGRVMTSLVVSSHTPLFPLVLFLTLIGCHDMSRCVMTNLVVS